MSSDKSNSKCPNRQGHSSSGICMQGDAATEPISIIHITSVNAVMIEMKGCLL